jgi:CheY-like chemotaxis protein
METKARVFIVEDHPATARALKTYLEVCGYGVEVASDVKSALRASEQKQFDVLVCDLHLPDGTGWELMRQLNALGGMRGVAFSALDGPEDRRRSKEAGFVEHVAKGSNPDTLLAAIDRASAHTRAEQKAGAATR